MPSPEDPENSMINDSQCSVCKHDASHAAAIVMSHKTEVITSSFVGDGGRKSKCFQTVSFPSGVCQTSTHGISPQAQATLIKKLQRSRLPQKLSWRVIKWTVHPIQIWYINIDWDDILFNVHLCTNEMKSITFFYCCKKHFPGELTLCCSHSDSIAT